MKSETDNYSIFTLCSKNYKDAYEFVIDSWLKTQAEKIFVYTDDSNWKSTTPRIKIIPLFSPSTDWLVNVGRKVHCLDHVHKVEEENNIIFLDIDCFLKEDLGHVFKNKFDMAVTRYEPKKVVSTGIFFIKRRDCAEKLIETWKSNQKYFKTRKKGMKPHQGSYSQLAFDKAVRNFHKNGIFNVKRLNVEEYGLKVKDVYKHKRALQKRGIDPNNFFQCTLEKASGPTVKVLHFYNNSYRNPSITKAIMDSLPT